MNLETYNKIMAGVKETTKFPKAIADTKGLLSRPEAEWLVRIPLVLGAGHYAELGTFLGRSACLLGQWISRTPGSKLTTVDLFDQRLVRHRFRAKDVDTYSMVLNLFKSKNLDKCIDVIKEDTADAASQIQNGSLIFLFIDADHSYEGVKRDFQAWEPKMLPGSLIAFHDSQLETISKFHSEISNWHEIDRVETLAVWGRNE